MYKYIYMYLYISMKFDIKCISLKYLTFNFTFIIHYSLNFEWNEECIDFAMMFFFFVCQCTRFWPGLLRSLKLWEISGRKCFLLCTLKKGHFTNFSSVFFVILKNLNSYKNTAKILGIPVLNKMKILFSP
jgi:hypothetical protein